MSTFFDAELYSVADLIHGSWGTGAEPVVVDARDTDKSGALGLFGTELSFDSYYGRNFDALEECLGDWAQSLTRCTALIWMPGAQLTGIEREIFEEVLSAVADGSEHLRVLTLA